VISPRGRILSTKPCLSCPSGFSSYNNTSRKMTARSAEALTSALGGIGKPAPSFELETDPIDTTTVQHHFYRRDPRSSSGRRRVTETWVRETVLSSSPSSSVWLERCDDVERQGPSLRVVKKIMIAPESKFDGHRELEAIFAFSHDKVLRYLWETRCPTSITGSRVLC
jgi:hypothetical protein